MFPDPSAAISIATTPLLMPIYHGPFHDPFNAPVSAAAAPAKRTAIVIAASPVIFILSSGSWIRREAGHRAILTSGRTAQHVGQKTPGPARKWTNSYLTPHQD